MDNILDWLNNSEYIVYQPKVRLHSKEWKIADDGSLEISLLEWKGATYEPLILVSFQRG
jgi:hypothetical protein